MYVYELQTRASDQVSVKMTAESFSQKDSKGKKRDLDKMYFISCMSKYCSLSWMLGRRTERDKKGLTLLPHN